MKESSSPEHLARLAQYWPTIIGAWQEHANKCPVIECDVVKMQVKAWPPREYIDQLSERTREETHRRYARATAAGGMLVFIRDSNKFTLHSSIMMPGDTPSWSAELQG